MRWVLIVSVGMVLASCGGADPSPPAEAPTDPSPGVTEWVAVLEVGSPDDLEPVQAELMAEAPGNISVSPVSCWGGLAQALDVPGAEYAAAVVAPSREQLEEVIAAVGREPVHVGEHSNACTD
ncbi:MAG TPA: hypothetical protein VEA19_06795 [Actinomycetota bacterium]|nr:hypothetical protein [Actinomycetota bacterium]